MSVIKIRDKETGEFIDIPALRGEGGIPAPATAKVGQTIVVKSVDANGKPTAWECVDLPRGGGADLMLFQCNGFYLAEVGMHWGDWILSRYNSYGFDEDGKFVLDNNGDYVSADGENPVDMQTVIDPSISYTTL